VVATTLIERPCRRKVGSHVLKMAATSVIKSLNQETP
jgi:hypothetical protein